VTFFRIDALGVTGAEVGFVSDALFSKDDEVFAESVTYGEALSRLLTVLGNGACNLRISFCNNGI